MLYDVCGSQEMLNVFIFIEKVNYRETDSYLHDNHRLTKRSRPPLGVIHRLVRVYDGELTSVDVGVVVQLPSLQSSSSPCLATALTQPLGLHTTTRHCD